ncbi:MAG TPA: long-chain fatty acid--CoA ligase [Acidimicrobiia bacterium]|nr:long-chain fatty acid--CoA ligase [Acidimicrobiia bacterium]
MTTDALTVREAQEIDAVIAGTTIVDVFNRNSDQYPDRPAVHWRRDDEWRSLSWSQYRTLVREIAAGLQTLGVGTGDFVAIQAGNRPEHVAADLAAIHLGATGVTIYSTLAAGQVQYVASDCGASVAILEDLGFMKKWEEIKPALPNLRYVVLMDGAENYADSDWVLSWDDLVDRGRRRLAADPQVLGSAEFAPDAPATLIYTSGTTGNPKGVVVTHRNVMWTAESVRRGAMLEQHPRFVSYLPLAHIAERMSSHYEGIYLAAEVFYCPDMTQVLEYVQRARPTLFVGVPRVWEKFHNRLQERFEDAEGIKATLLHKALELGRKKVEAEQAGTSLGTVDGLLHGLLDKVVLAKVRGQLGMDELQFSISAAAPINPELLYFFQSLGVPLFELYGLSETTGPATTNTPGANRIGTVGRALPGVEVLLGADDEILLRGGVITAGYWNLPEETVSTFDSDGWLHTGDLGRLDDSGYLSIIGRKKDIIITAAGKNVAPARLETLLANHPLISKACLVGDGRSYLTALIALDSDEVPGWAEKHGLTYADLAAFSRLPEVAAEVERAVAEANEQVARVEQVKKHYVVPDEWTPESGEVTASLKLKRAAVLALYAAEIENLYR